MQSFGGGDDGVGTEDEVGSPTALNLSSEMRPWLSLVDLSTVTHAVILCA